MSLKIFETRMQLAEECDSSKECGLNSNENHNILHVQLLIAVGRSVSLNEDCCIKCFLQKNNSVI